jgi:hypothetical protein
MRAGIALPRKKRKGNCVQGGQADVTRAQEGSYASANRPTLSGGIEVAGGLDMATRAELFRTEEQRHSKRKKAQPSPAKKKAAAEGRPAKPRGAAAHATAALEAPAANGRRSRKSTRGSANRAKPDTNFNLRESLVKGSPEARFRKARAKKLRVRGSTV